MTEDEALLAQLRGQWTSVDPEPADLADRTLLLLQLADLDLDFDLLRRNEDVGKLVGARGEETATTISFDNDSLTVMITTSAPAAGVRRVDGWLAPGAALRVELRTVDGSRHVEADADGRFAFTDAPAGLVQFVVHPTVGAGVDLPRSVATPPLQLWS